ncbi:50S ribosomal protein L9 [Candidatus Peregrinibacteria bacterium]|jgi:large subunit ribosomal protein L9|nr:50S ribosomal protein L9 [Candidatus Peregrinibacteria bacterium]MBT4631906.1 50S ribosomal protein L9 [Candidatus Peregrinibacteria bacterium]MBT5516548.1 50S ribosomal protein L9 [Candidatus Peregrinibacteria bacterium]MBT5824173.1 50S ribosomal protein L9 [Candidatus Peregrinibacteria bacterium]
MKVILTQNVKGLGQKGEVKEVNDGYFRNMLAPRKLASIASSGNVAQIAAQKAKATEKLEAMKESAESIKSKINGKSIAITGKATEAGHLYAAVSKSEIVTALKEQLKADIPEKALIMKSAIKEPGDFDIDVKLHSEVKAQFNLHVATE